jgi:hypothetical protein
MTPLEIAKQYFDLSNNSDFAGIAKLFTNTTSYSSANTGVYLGVGDIINMQKDFHAKFKRLIWKINSVEEIKPGIILFKYDFEATTNSGDEIQSTGLEYVIVANGKIQHIEIRNT